MPRTRSKIQTAALVVVASTACSQPSHEEHADTASSAPTLMYGAVMADVARRFELFGRAALAERFELAEYEVGEIEEQFAEVLPHASTPREGHPEVLPGLRKEFLGTVLPELHRDLKTHDPAKISVAFARTATACNGCHQASGHGFIEVPTVPGRSIPNTTPATPESPSH